MAEIQTPKALIDIAKKYGVDLDSTIKYDAEGALKAVSAYFNGESDADSFGAEADADFGFGFKMPKLKSVVKKVAAKASAKVKVAAPRKPVLTFSVSSKLKPLQALGAADKLLGSTSITNRPQVIKATQALAALGNKDAIRGLATIATVAQIRAKAKTPPGKKAIPNAPQVPVKKVSKPVSKAKVFNMAQAKVTADTKKNANLTFIQKIKKFFGFKV